MVSNREMPGAMQEKEKGKSVAEITRHFNWRGDKTASMRRFPDFDRSSL